jgi:succinoglycan biosynthesis transport protein ExoP
MHRRLLVFLIVFLTACAGGFAYLYSIKPVYVGRATIRVDLGDAPTEPKAASFVADEAQALNSNETLAALIARINATNPRLSAFANSGRLRETLDATPVSGTSVIELKASGSERAELAELLDAWSAVFLEARRTHQTENRTVTVQDARRTVEGLEQRVARKRHELDQFRQQHDIVSSERGENEVAAQMRSLSAALQDARSKAGEAESRLSAIKQSIADGTPVYRAEDKATIAQLEQRILEMKQTLKDLELRFTPQYLALEPGVKTMRANIAQIEQQIQETRRTGQQAALNEAQQNLVAAQKNVTRVETQLSEGRKDALRFTSQFSEQKAYADDLLRLESQLREARERLATVERNDRSREATYQLLGAATVPETPAYPDYMRYGGITVAAAFGAAVFSVLLVEFLSPRPVRRSDTNAQPIIQIAYPGWPQQALARVGNTELTLPMPQEATPVARLAAPVRELTVDEVQRMWQAATAGGRLAIAALFTGLTLDELASLEWSDVDSQADCLHLRRLGRVHPLTEPLKQVLQARSSTVSPAAKIATTPAGVALSSSDLAGLVAAAAHDAEVDQADSIDPGTLRHTYICHLVRQGLRLSDLEELAGPIAPSLFLEYRNFSPRARRSAREVNNVFPAFTRP